MKHKIVKHLGFESFDEYNSMISSIDLSTPENLKSFYKWKNHDGTKAGLKKLKP